MNKKGFTLIELLAVIIILAIVALIATPIVLDVVDNAKDSAAVSESNMIIDGIENNCANLIMKKQMDTTDIVELCPAADLAQAGNKAKFIDPTLKQGNATINSIQYDGKRITQVEIISNGRKCTIGSDSKVTCSKQ